MTDKSKLNEYDYREGYAYNFMNEKKIKNEIILLVLEVIGLTIFADVVILRLLPKSIVFFAEKMGFQLVSTDLLTKYGMGLCVRIIGIAIIIFILKKTNMSKIFTYKIYSKYILISWMFLIYILANIEMGDLKNTSAALVFSMMIEAISIGFFEELVFRGTMLPLFLRVLRNRKNGVMLSVLISSAIFGLFHFSNLLTGASLVVTCMQVVY